MSSSKASRYTLSRDQRALLIGFPKSACPMFLGFANLRAMLRGQRALRAHLTKTGRGELVRLARALQVSPATVHGWTDRHRPRFERRQLLERATNGAVTASLWMTARERELFAA